MKNYLMQVVRIGFGVLALTAILAQLDRHVGQGFSMVNFFSYFTNLSNMVFAVVLLTSAVVILLGQKPSPLFDAVRGASILNMLIVGIVFSLLLRNEDLGTLMPWVNFVLHYLMPVVALADWWLVRTRLKMDPKILPAWLVFPLGYVIYCLIRGAHRHWYPYPFLNPDKAGGYLGVALYSIGICVLFVVCGWLLILIARRTKSPLAL